MNSTSNVNKWFKPYTQWSDINIDFLKINSYYMFDLQKALINLEEIKKKYNFKEFPLYGRNSNKTTKMYRGIGFTSKNNSLDPLYESLYTFDIDNQDINLYNKYKNDYDSQYKHSKIFMPYERDFCSPTEIYTGYFKEIIDKFKKPITKVRLLELRPGGFLPIHVDFPYYEQVRLHAVLTTNEYCTWTINGKNIQIPADGNFYWFDTGKYHSIENKGKTSRIVLSINLSLYYDRFNNLTTNRNFNEYINSVDL